MGHYFITGASSGIGKALSIALASEGHVVSAVARRIEHLKKIKGKHFELWAQLIKNYKEINLVINTINNVFDENGNIKDNASKNLKKINQSINSIHKNIEKKIQVEFKKYSKMQCI